MIRSTPDHQPYPAGLADALADCFEFLLQRRRRRPAAPEAVAGRAAQKEALPVVAILAEGTTGGAGDHPAEGAERHEPFYSPS